MPDQTAYELTILMPCLNEAETIRTCISRAKSLLEQHSIIGEVLISDNGSTDGSQQIAKEMGARVIDCPVRGYGAALLFGIENSFGRFVLMGDSDDSYRFNEAMPLIEKLREGYDVCMGSRLNGTIMPNAMPRLNRYLGNPILTRIGRILFGISMSDFHCGMRAFRKDAILNLGLVTTGMEWASEMIIKAWLARLSFAEVPITLYKDGRSRPPHLRRWRDGWRHLRFMLLHAPFWIFTFPGIILMLIGTFGQALLFRGMIQLGRIHLDVHSMLVCAILVILGSQAIFAGLFARLYSSLNGILPYDDRFDRAVRKLSLEKLLIICLCMGVIGGGSVLYTTIEWARAGFADLDYQVIMRRLIPSLTLVSLAIQGIFNGFMLSILFLRTKSSKAPALD